MSTIDEQKQEEVRKLIEAKTNAAYDLIRECEKLADDHRVDFSFKVAYGMGG